MATAAAAEPPRPRPRRRWQRWRWGLGALFGCVIAGVSGWWLTRPAPAPICHGRPLDEWLPRLVTGFEQDRAEARQAVLAGPPGTVTWLAGFLREHDPRSRRLLLKADPKLKPGLRLWLHRRLKPFVTTHERAGAATALGLFGDARPEVLAALRGALQDPSRMVWQAAVLSLAALGQAGGETLLTAVPEVPSEVRSLALSRLAPTNAPAGATVRAILTEATRGGSRRSLASWGSVVARFGAAAAPAAYETLEAATEEQRQRGVTVMGAAAGTSYPLLREWIRRLPERSPAGRLIGVNVLREVPLYGARCVVALAGAMRDPDPAVRAEAAKGLLERRQESGLHRTAPLLTAALQDPDPAIRRDTARLLGQLGEVGRTALPALRKLTKDPAPPVREAAATALKLLTDTSSES